MTVEFTQYLMPDGRKQIIHIDLDEEYEILAEKIIADGNVFEIEVLTTGQISMTISDDEGDLFIEVCDNGPEVPIHVLKLIDNYKRIFYDE